MIALQPDLAGPPETTTIALRRFAGILALIPAFLLYLLYRARPRPYIRAWIAMWLGLASPLLIGSVGTEVLNLGEQQGRLLRLNVGRLVVAVSALVWLGGMGLLGISASWFRSTMRFPRWVKLAVLLVSAWFLIGSVTIGLVIVVQGALAIGAALFAYDAIAFLRLARRERLVGALMIGLPLIAVPIDLITNGMTGLTRVTGFVGVWIWTLVYAVVALGMHVLVFEDMTWELRQRNTELRNAQAELKARAITDPLTGCFNRRFFDEIAPHHLKRHQRYQLPLSLLFFDCDRFKEINDTSGHEGGDRVLTTIGTIIRGLVRETDYVFRWGGDEFLAIVTCDEKQARRKAQQIQEAFAATGASLSVGIATVPDDAKDLMTFVQLADARMYQAKRALA